MDLEDGELQIDFLNYNATLLDNLNKHRLQGRFCDIAVHLQGRVFKAHKVVLAASSRYFHDQLLLSDLGTVLLPDVLDPTIFERILVSAYTGRLRLTPDNLGGYLTVGSFLQMWHVVDKCNELLKNGCLLSRPPRSSRSSENQSPSSSNYFNCKDAGDPWNPEGSLRDVFSSQEASSARHVLSEKSQEGDESGFSIRTICIDDDLDISSGPSCSFSNSADAPSSVSQQVKQEITEEEEEQHRCKEDGRRFPANGIPAGPLEQLINIAEIRSLSGLEFGIDNGESADFSLGSLHLEGQPEKAVEEAPVLECRSLSHKPPGQLSHGPVEHMSRHGKKIYGCLCGKRFPEKGRRDRHVILRISMRPFACTLCNKKFKLKHHLNEHMVVHMDRQLHECQTCGKKFKMYDCFQRHRENCQRLNNAVVEGKQAP
ncbi:zinc finger and BTB domain-containing protein 22-like [Latimeria chalumnae]|uniref:Zinc finger and BTB domain containing 22 n=1 Tax=Latimeria chalumnae TaxID=7897 RepID=H3A1S3_LATCH|nr:PREDICTED: zinc finger and BTB domain-containing protein 22-like [Latimeria chalumnae]XP_014346891.1 PREDICTED: zinc finger and BTB domain-containing protein 22-like [Latimeria chalumnae]|eukprot:XP_006000992.1 PREDICTED: zinc finger and BTB domain-containing protein 22-like [Latimeria chalumnae]